MQEHPEVNDSEKADNAKQILEKNKQDVRAYAQGAIVELSRYLFNCKAETKRKKLVCAIRRWELVLKKTY